MNIRDYFNSFKQTDFVDSVTQIGNQYGYINSRNYFNIKSTNQTAIVFDVDKTTTTLLPQVNRGDKSSTQGREHAVNTLALKLAYFKHDDRLTNEDIQGWRAPGRTDSETYARATAEKLTDMRRVWDQTKEYMSLQAIKGICKSPDGITIVNSFTEFGVSQSSVDFLLGTSTTDIDSKIATLKRTMSRNIQNGGGMSGVEILVDPTFFDRLISHPNMKNAYQYYLNSGKQELRDDLSDYMTWGIMDSFEHRGVRFISYDATFNLPNATTELAFAANTGTAYPLGVPDLFRGYNGPSVKLSEANQPGQELFMRTYLDPRDEFVDFELEAAPLLFCTRPASLIAVSSSN